MLIRIVGVIKWCREKLEQEIALKVKAEAEQGKLIRDLRQALATVQQEMTEKFQPRRS